MCVLLCFYILFFYSLDFFAIYMFYLSKNTRPLSSDKSALLFVNLHRTPQIHITRMLIPRSDCCVVITQSAV